MQTYLYVVSYIRDRGQLGVFSSYEKAAEFKRRHESSAICHYMGDSLRIDRHEIGKPGA